MRINKAVDVLLKRFVLPLKGDVSAVHDFNAWFICQIIFVHIMTQRS